MMETLINFSQFLFSRKSTQKSYVQMRTDYIHSKPDINWISKIIKVLYPKYKIETSDGILGKLKKEDVRKIVSVLKENGYYVFPQLLPQDLILSIRKFAENTPVEFLTSSQNVIQYSREKVLYKQSRHVSNRFQFNYISDFENNKLIKKIACDINLLHIANEYLGTKPLLDLIILWWSSIIPGNLSEDEKKSLYSASAQMFHFDMDRLRFLKFFIYLTDVDSKTGPHVYVKGSHNKIPHYIDKDGRYADDLIEKNDSINIVEIAGKAGTIIAVDTRGLHKGKILERDDRLIFQIEFTNSFFGKPEFQKVDHKIAYEGDVNYFDSYKLYFKKDF